MRKQANDLIAKLEGEKAEVDMGCTCYWDILIGDVLERMKDDYEGQQEQELLLQYWRDCEISKSLQSIVECEWVKYCDYDNHLQYKVFPGCSCCGDQWQPKPKEVRDLITFILTLNLCKTNTTG